MDRFVKGFIIGAVTNSIKAAINWFGYSFLHFPKVTYAHFMAAFLLGRQVRSGFDLVLAQVVEIGFGGFIGVMFIYFAYRTKKKNNLWFKGFLFANIVYGLVYIVGSFFRIPYQFNVPIETAISNFLGSSIFGFMLGFGTYWWGKRVGDFQDNEGLRNW